LDAIHARRPECLPYGDAKVAYQQIRGQKIGSLLLQPISDRLKEADSPAPSVYEDDGSGPQCPGLRLYDLVPLPDIDQAIAWKKDGANIG
jgi:hypothetical protein